MIVLVRHGRTEANARRLLVGRVDPALDSEGHRQAAATARAGAATTDRVSHVVSSPLDRCRTTAAAVAADLDVPVVVDDRWIELDYGELDGTPMASVPAGIWAAWQSDPTWRPPGGESLAELGGRVRGACEELAAATGTGEGGEDVVVVSHVSPIKAAVGWALGTGDDLAWRMVLRPASITRIDAGDRRALHSFNETCHLHAGI